ncbi:hypothetical protein FGLOB1_14305 [Fusarium globosum]|uniref:Uncharacterized protein n=1 Tax=Fusarium globosum TaxID=78864 RepID=A0A8H5XHS2_9HYPO|nr:hypothetical protein FGLOB1_14305 [Fusarium globosum]
MLVLRRDAAFERSAGQVSCYFKDLETERQGLLKLPVSLMPKEALNLLNRFYKTYDEGVKDWARERNFNIERYPYLGPQILLLQSGDIQLSDDRVSVVIFIPRPKVIQEKEGIAAAGEEVSTKPPSIGLQETSFRISVQSPIGGPVFAASPTEFEVGDIAILEGGERLSGRGDDVCMLCALHRTNKIAPEKKDNNQM